LKYAGLRYDEIWISEAQERMLLSVPPEKVEDLLELAEEENVEATVIGEFGTENSELILNYREAEVGRISMRFLHEGLPMPTRKAVVAKRSAGFQPVPSAGEERHGLKTRATKERLLELLSHPNIASKHWIIRQYDHEVQGGSVIKPLIGPKQIGPSDAAVIRPKLSSQKGVVIACGLAPHIVDPYAMAIASIDEAIRNAVAIGADPTKLAILDNFCWPSVDDEQTMGTLVAACEACYDAAKAYGIPFISGKDSLHNQFTNQETKQVLKIPNTLLISAIGVIEDVRNCITMDLKKVGNSLWRILPRLGPAGAEGLKYFRWVHEYVYWLITAGIVRSAHDVSDGGTLVAVAEMMIASGLGVELSNADMGLTFDELQGSYVLEIEASKEEELFRPGGMASAGKIGMVTGEGKLVVGQETIGVEELTKAWRGALDW
jgi:phosphoribosylformylglycinamidine synthase